MLALNPSLDWAHWQSELQRHGRTQVQDFLSAESAHQLATVLAHDTPWDVALRDAEGPKRIAAEQWGGLDSGHRERLLDGARAHAKEGFAFIYRTYMMIPRYLERHAPDHPLHGLVESLNAPHYQQRMRELTGDARVIKVDCQATCYLPGDFLLPHNDHDAEQGRLYAYVLNLSEDWQSHWGGLLQFGDDQGGVLATLVPRFNSLSIFKVPADHHVTLVSPWAARPRVAVTGWLRMR